MDGEFIHLCPPFPLQDLSTIPSLLLLLLFPTRFLLYLGYLSLINTATKYEWTATTTVTQQYYIYTPTTTTIPPPPPPPRSIIIPSQQANTRHPQKQTHTRTEPPPTRFYFWKIEQGKVSTFVFSKNVYFDPEFTHKTLGFLVAIVHVVAFGVYPPLLSLSTYLVFLLRISKRQCW